MFLSTLQAYFEGKKELFENTYIATKEKEWFEYLVLKLDLNAENYEAAPSDVISQRIDATLKTKGFYGVLKSMNQYIKFAFLTGVTKFGKVSVFCDLNNLKDISMIPKYWDICGITEDEIKDNFDYDIELLASENEISKEECFCALKRKYDGYHFYEKRWTLQPFQSVEYL